MFRKFAIAAAAIAALGTASLTASTPAAAWGKGGSGFHHFHGGGFGFYPVVGVYDVDSCYRSRLVVNRRGEVVRRVYNICD